MIFSHDLPMQQQMYYIAITLNTVSQLHFFTIKEALFTKTTQDDDISLSFTQRYQYYCIANIIGR